MSDKREVTAYDFIMPEFRGKKPEDYEFREDGKIVRKDRWMWAVLNIAGTVGVNTNRGYEIDDIKEAVRKAAHEQDDATLIASIKAFFSESKAQRFIEGLFYERDMHYLDSWERLQKDGSLSDLSPDIVATVTYILKKAEYDATEEGYAEKPERPDAGQIPTYRCHKTVRAFEIGRIVEGLIYPADETLCGPIRVDVRFLQKHPLDKPGYLVIYKDGFMSYSPKEAFEYGYSETIAVKESHE